MQIKFNPHLYIYPILVIEMRIDCNWGKILKKGCVRKIKVGVVVKTVTILWLYKDIQTNKGS